MVAVTAAKNALPLEETMYKCYVKVLGGDGSGAVTASGSPISFDSLFK